MGKPNTLKVSTPSDREILMTRAFDAPRKLVWEAMTRPDLIRRWLFTPPGWQMTECEEDLRVGGSFRWVWAGPDGSTAMVMRGVYREVSPPQPDGRGGRLVRTETFDMGCPDQSGEQLATIEITEADGAGAKYRRAVLSIRVLYPSQAARDGAIASGMEHGVSAGCDRMEELLLASAER